MLKLNWLEEWIVMMYRVYTLNPPLNYGKISEEDFSLGNMKIPTVLFQQFWNICF